MVKVSENVNGFDWQRYLVQSQKRQMVMLSCVDSNSSAMYLELLRPMEYWQLTDNSISLDESSNPVDVYCWRRFSMSLSRLTVRCGFIDTVLCCATVDAAFRVQTSLYECYTAEWIASYSYNVSLLTLAHWCASQVPWFTAVAALINRAMLLQVLRGVVIAN